MASTLAFAEGQHAAPRAPAAELGACSIEEVAHIFELIRQDYFSTSVFCELGRDTGIGHNASPYHAIAIADLLRRTRLENGERLMGRLEVINAALRGLRGDAQATLFGFDQFGRLYIHETTHRNIAAFWDHLLARDGVYPVEQPAIEAERPAKDPSSEVRGPQAGSGAALDEILGTPL